MKLTGTPDHIIYQVLQDCPGALDGVERARANVPFIKREIARYQAAVLHALASRYNREGAHILEIGTAWGYSAAVMAEAAPLAEIVTLNPKQAEYECAVGHLAVYENVMPVLAYSWDYLTEDLGDFDLIFVDGSHNQVSRDMPWWDRVAPGGLFLFHDYSPEGSGRPTPEVYAAVNLWMADKGLEPYVLVVDHRQVGMIGFRKEDQ